MTRGLLFLSLLLAFCFAPSTEQDPAPLEVGRPAPALDVEWLDGKAPVDLGRGRAAVLVFWAPWCGSCLAEFPRLNQLARELAAEPLDFVALAQDPRETVVALLGERPLVTRTALDPTGATFDAYGVSVLPRLVLVDPAGKIAALPRLEDVTTEHLLALAAGETLDLERALWKAPDLQWDRARAPFDLERSLAHAWIEPSDAAGSAYFFPPGRGRITADGVVFAVLVQVANGAEPYQVVSTLPAMQDVTLRYRLSVKAPDDAPETARAMLRELVARLVPHRAEWVEREEPTLVLRRLPGHALTRLVPVPAGEPDGLARSGQIHYSRVPMRTLVDSLAGLGFHADLLDETGLEGTFDVTLDWTPTKAGALEAALRECGLEVTREPRRVRRLMVSPVAPVR